MSIAFRSTGTSHPRAAEQAVSIVATDGELLMRFVRQRDQDAFAEIVERHGRLVWTICRQVLRHHQDVEDAFQATFLILAQRAQSIRASESASAWLYKVAMRTALLARRKRCGRREEPLVVEPPADDVSRTTIDNREMLYVLLQEMHSLPARYQTPLVMRYLEGQSRRAIAEQTDSTVGQIQGRLARGRRMLRSRFLRRGVSLSLAAGAVASTAESAKAAVTPSLVASTARTCLRIKTSGIASGISPAVIALVKEGVNAMWMTFVTKCAAVASAVVLTGGIVWATQQGGGNGSAKDTGRVAINLLAAGGENDAAQRGEKRSQNVDAAAAGRKQAADFLAGRLKYKVPVEIGRSEFKEGGHIEIEEVWGTRPTIEVGGQYMVRGKYVLPPGQRGKLHFYETATGDWRRDPSANVDLQTIELNEEKGEFTLVHSMGGPGYFHLYLAPPNKYSRMFANVYFGTGDNVLREERLGLAAAAGNASQAKEHADEAATKPMSNEAAKAAQAAEEKQTEELLNQVEAVQSDLNKRRRERSQDAARLELAQLEKSFIQQQLERLNKTLSDLDTSTGVDEDAEKARIKRRDDVARLFENAKRELMKHVDGMAELSNDVESRQQEVNRLQRRLDELDRLRIQQELRRLTQVGSVERAVQPLTVDRVAAPIQARFQNTPVISYPDFERVQLAGAQSDVLFFNPTPTNPPAFNNVSGDELNRMRLELDKLKAENAALRRQAELSRPGASSLAQETRKKVLRPGDQIIVSVRAKYLPLGKTQGSFFIGEDGKIVLESNNERVPLEVSGMDQQQAAEAFRKVLKLPDNAQIIVEWAETSTQIPAR